MTESNAKMEREVQVKEEQMTRKTEELETMNKKLQREKQW